MAAQPISRFLRPPAIQPPKLSRYTAETTESGSQKRGKKHAGQATRDWREAQGKTPATYPPRNNAHPPKIKIEHICQAKIPGKRQQLACEPEQEPTLEAVEEEVEARQAQPGWGKKMKAGRTC